jgi:stalled ribosome rescue protein Dom34
VGISSNVAFAICHSCGKTGIDEVLKSKEVIQALQNERTSKEMSAVEELLKNISIGKLFSYGFSDVESKVNMGAVIVLLVTDGFIKKKRSSENFQELDNILNLVEKTNGKIMIVSSENDAGKKLDGLTGIGAILRYDLE